MTSPLPTYQIASPILGSRSRDLVVFFAILVALAALTNARLLVYYQFTVAEISYYGTTESGEEIPLHAGPRAERTRGGSSRTYIQSRAQRIARESASKLAIEDTYKGRRFQEIRWKIQLGPHEEALSAGPEGSQPVNHLPSP